MAQSTRYLTYIDALRNSLIFKDYSEVEYSSLSGCLGGVYGSHLAYDYFSRGICFSMPVNNFNSPFRMFPL